MKEPIPKAAKHFYSFGAFRLYVAERELFRGDEPVTLSLKTFDTLLLLLRRHGHVVDKDELMAAVWPDEKSGWWLPMTRWMTYSEYHQV